MVSSNQPATADSTLAAPSRRVSSGRIALPSRHALAAAGPWLVVALAAVGLIVATVHAAARGAVPGFIPGPGGHIVALDPGSPASAAGLRTGDRVAAINRLPVDDAAWSALHGLPALGDALVSIGSPGRFRLFDLVLMPASTVQFAGDVAALAVAAFLCLAAALSLARPRTGTAAPLLAVSTASASLAVSTSVMAPWHLWIAWIVVPAAALAALTVRTAAGLQVAGQLSPRAVRLPIVVAIPSMLLVFVAMGSHDDQWLVWAMCGAAALSVTAIVSPITNRILRPGTSKALITALSTLCGLIPIWLWPGFTVLSALTGREVHLAYDPAPAALWACAGLAPMAVMDLAVGSRIFSRPAEPLSRLLLSIVAGLAGVGLAWLIVGPVSPAVPPAALAIAGLVIFIAVQQGASALLARYIQAPPAAVEAAIAEVTAHAEEPGTAEHLAAGLVERLARVLHVEYVAITAAESPASPGERILAAHSSAGPEAPGLPPEDCLPEWNPWTNPTAHMMKVPLRGDGAVSGALYLGVSSPGRWPEYDPGDLDRLGLTLGMAIRGRLAAAQLEERANSMVALARRLSQAHEQERANLSRELHDVVAQELIALTRHLRRYNAENLPPPAIWADMLAGAQDALVAIRRICNGLRPAILDLGLVPALRDLISSVAETSDADVGLSVIGQERRLDGDLEFALFRVAQESLSNAIAHAGATMIRVEVEFADRVVVRVRDDGRGFEVPDRFEDLPGDHLGMLGMRERVALHGGQLSVTSARGRGTTVEAWIAPKG